MRGSGTETSNIVASLPLAVLQPGWPPVHRWTSAGPPAERLHCPDSNTASMAVLAVAAVVPVAFGVTMMAVVGANMMGEFAAAEQKALVRVGAKMVVVLAAAAEPQAIVLAVAGAMMVVPAVAGSS